MRFGNSNWTMITSVDDKFVASNGNFDTSFVECAPPSLDEFRDAIFHIRGNIIFEYKIALELTSVFCIIVYFVEIWVGWWQMFR
jgi:hypothetical protein